MKKKTENMIKYFLGVDKQRNLMYTRDEEGNYYVTDGKVMIQFDEPLSDLALGTALTVTIAKKLMNMDKDLDSNYIMCELPSKETIKAEIKRLVGRSYNNNVVWCEGSFAVNARYLLKIMEGFNATKVYISEKDPNKNGMFIYEEDEPWATKKAFVLPVKLLSNEPGFRAFSLTAS